MNYVQYAITKIIGTILNTSIKLGNLLEYDFRVTLVDLTSDNQLVTRGMLNAATGGFSNIVVSIPAGSAIPFPIDMTLPQFANVSMTFLAQIELLNAPFATAIRAKTIYDVGVEKVYTDDTRTVLSVVNVYGHPNDTDGTTTQDDIQLLIR